MVTLEVPFEPSFFAEEVRSGFTVTKQRKELWAVELDLLVKFDQFCRAHNLIYCVGAGTMLGAIRHKGFIPWDDDIDLYMPRKDYDRLMTLAGEFQAPYFLQTSYSEKNMLRGYARLRNSLTTGASVVEQHRPINKGLFIDICPIDGISENKKLDKKQLKKHKYYRWVFGVYNATRSPRPGMNRLQKIKQIVTGQLADILVGNKEKFFRKYEANLKKYSIPSTKLWGNRTLVFECPKSRRPIEDYTDLVMMPFEFIEVPVPRNYDSMLRQQYGDYMKIPENKNGSMHGELIISTDYAYDDPRRTQEQ